MTIINRREFFKNSTAGTLALSSLGFLNTEVKSGTIAQPPINHKSNRHRTLREQLMDDLIVSKEIDIRLRIITEWHLKYFQIKKYNKWSNFDDIIKNEGKFVIPNYWIDKSERSEIIYNKFLDASRQKFSDLCFKQLQFLTPEIAYGYKISRIKRYYIKNQKESNLVISISFIYKKIYE